MPYTSRCARRYGTHVTFANARRVWAAVTRRPTATVRELADDAGLPFGTVGAALRMLRDAGYIEFDPCTGRARRVLVPFIITGGH